MNRLALTVTTGWLLAAGMQSPPREAPVAAHGKAVAAVGAAVPFAAGERLNYQILWGPALAATAELNAVERRGLYGKEAWHFRARASTVNPARLLYQLDDQFDSYTEAATLASLRYETYIHEQGQKQTNVYRMVRDGEPAPAGGRAVRVPPGTLDPLGLLYALRAVDWSSTARWDAPLFDGKKLYEIRAQRVAGASSVMVAGKRHTVSRVELRVFHRGRELPQARFWVSLAGDAECTPVLIEADLPFGKLRVELQKKPAH
jgi:hypothetical protein